MLSIMRHGIAKMKRGSKALRRALRRRRKKLRSYLLWLEPLEDRTLMAVSITGSIFHDLLADGLRQANEPSVPGIVAFLDANSNGVVDGRQVPFRNDVANSFVPGSALPPTLAGVAGISTIQVSGVETPLTDVSLTLDISRGDGGPAGNLEIALLSPTGAVYTTGATIFHLARNSRFTGTLTDQASGLPPTNGIISTNVSGTFKPLQSFSRPDLLIKVGDPNGTWYLLVVQSVTNVTLHNWSLTFPGSEISTVSDDGGNYSFHDLPDGSHRVAVAVPNGPAAKVVTVSGGQLVSGVDFGIVPPAELLATSFAVTSDPATDWGSQVTVNYTVQNQGAGAAGAFDIDLVLSADATITGGDTLLQTINVSGGLGAGQTLSGSIAVTLPGAAGSPPSGFSSVDIAFLGLRVDSANTVLEANEANNANQGQRIDVAAVLRRADVALTSDPGAQHQPSVAVDPRPGFANHVVVAYMDYALQNNGYAGIAVKHSLDGGLTWTTSTVPLPAGFDEAAGYPKVVFDNLGRAYVTFMAATFHGPKPPVIFPDGTRDANNRLLRSYGLEASNGVFLSRSDDGGVTWNAPVAVASNAHTQGGAKVSWEVLPDLAINRTNGNLYVSWTRIYKAGAMPGIPAGNGGTDIMVAVSINAGATFTTRLNGSPPRTVIAVNRSAAFDEGGGLNNFSHVAVDSAGLLFVSYNTGGQFAVSRSVNAGVSFLNPTVAFIPTPNGSGGQVVNAVFPDTQLYPGAPLHNFPVRGILTDPTRPNNFYAYEAIKVNQGLSTTANQIDRGEIAFSFSLNRGGTYRRIFNVGDNPSNLSEVPLNNVRDYFVSLNDDNANRYLRFDPSLGDEVISTQAQPVMAIDAQGRLVAMWLDSRRDPSGRKFDVFASVSSDGGLNWSANFRITDVSFDPETGKFTDGQGNQNAFFGDYAGLAAAGGFAYAAWTDTRDGNQNIYFNRFPIIPAGSPPNDRFEPNDIPAAATVLGPVTVQQTLTRLQLAGADEDWFQVTPQSQNLIVSVSPLERADVLELDLFDAGGVLVASGIDVLDSAGRVIGKQFAAPAAAGQDYFVRVRGVLLGETPVDYTLNLSSLTEDFGTLVYASVDRNLVAGGRHVYLLTAAVDGSMTVNLAELGISGKFHVRLLSSDAATVLGSATLSGPNGLAQVAQFATPVRQGQALLLQVFPADDEQQYVSIPNSVSKLTFRFNGVAATQLTFSSSTTAAQIQANLNTIAALAGNVLVTRPEGGDFLVTFTNQLAAQDLANLTATRDAGTGTIFITQAVKGGGTSTFTGTSNGDYNLTLTNLDQYQTPNPETLFFATGATPTDLAVTDLDSDGRQDLIAATTDPASAVSVLRGTGLGVFWAAQGYKAGAAGSSRELVVDKFNGPMDPFDDVVVSNSNSADVSLLTGLGNTTLGPERRSDATAQALALAAGDFNGDGFRDLAVLERIPPAGATSSFSMILGRGDGTFGVPQKTATGFGQGANIILVADFNNDGKDDVAVFGNNQAVVEIYLGNGDGTFGQAIVTNSPEAAAAAVAARIDSDTKLDLVIGGTNNGRVYVLSGNGDGTFGVGQSLSANTAVNRAAASVSGLVVVDAGGSTGFGTATDGALDIIVVTIPRIGGEAPHINFLPGIASGTFAEAQRVRAGPFTGPLAAGDFNNDGAVDLAAAEPGGIRAIYGQPVTFPANNTMAAARNLGNLLHVVTPPQAISPFSPVTTDSWFKLTVPTDIPGSGDQVLDFSALLEHVGGSGVGIEVTNAQGVVLASGTRFRLRAAQGETLFVHVFSVHGDGFGVYTLSIDVLPQIVGVQALSVLPTADGQSSGPVSSLLITLQGDRLDRATAENPANYRVIWFGPDGLAGTADDSVIPLSTDANAVIYNQGANVNVSAGRTLPAATRQTITLNFDNPLPAGSYRIEVSGIQTDDFNGFEDGLLVAANGFGGHPLVSVNAAGAISEGAAVTVENLVQPVGSQFSFGQIASGTAFLTQLHDDLGALLDSLLAQLGDDPTITAAITNQIQSRFEAAALGDPQLTFFILWFDPVSLSLEDPQGARTVYDLQTNTVVSNTARTYIEVGGNVEVIVMAGVSGTFRLNVSDVQNTARGGGAIFSSGKVETFAMTDAIRGGAFAFEVTVPTPPPTMPATPPVTSASADLGVTSFFNSSIVALTTILFGFSDVSFNDSSALNEKDEGSLLVALTNFITTLVGYWPQYSAEVAAPTSNFSQFISALSDVLGTPDRVADTAEATLEQALPGAGELGAMLQGLAGTLGRTGADTGQAVVNAVRSRLIGGTSPVAPAAPAAPPKETPVPEAKDEAQVVYEPETEIVSMQVQESAAKLDALVVASLFAAGAINQGPWSKNSKQSRREKRRKTLLPLG